MSLYGNRDQSNNAPIWKVGSGLGLKANTAANASVRAANGQVLFANTVANAFHANVTTTIWGVNDTEKLRFANVAPTFSGMSNVGAAYRINDLISFTNTGSLADVNADAIVSGLVVCNITGIQSGGAGYAANDKISVAGTGVKAVLNVFSVSVGAVTAVNIVSFGLYTANFASLSNIQTSNVTGAGNACAVNVAIGIGTLTINNSGAYPANSLGRPTTTVLNNIAGGSSANARANLVFLKNDSLTGGAGWVLKTVQDGGQVQYEILVAQGSITSTGFVDKGTM